MVGPKRFNMGLQQLASEIPHRPALLVRKFPLILSIVYDSPYLQLHFLKKGQKIQAWLVRQCPKENVFFY